VISLERREGRPLRIGHRGAAALAPENTIASFRAAVAAGVDLVEFDVLRLRSGEIVVAHSTDLREMSHGAVEGDALALSLAELRSTCPDLPTLDEALAFFANEATETGVHVDLKSAGAAEEVATALRLAGLVDRTLLSSFHAGALRRLRDLEPTLRTGMSFPRDRLRFDGKPRLDPAVRGGLRALRTATPALVGLLLARSRGSALVLHHELVSRHVVTRSHARDAPVVVWTVDTPEALARVDEAGVDAVVTNDPSIFVSTLTS
jgi:glycerophosphoryl diester phosphodiesterase